MSTAKAGRLRAARVMFEVNAPGRIGLIWVTAACP